MTDLYVSPSADIGVGSTFNTTSKSFLRRNTTTPEAQAVTPAILNCLDSSLRRTVSATPSALSCCAVRVSPPGC
ncbi:hypothetical protein FA95DRAFT_1614326 [Auriscalpium vulgare]|uniref:Uncharacterized protein n=1 Tax=Auriscalpium vulgare TaxID=40419 RepID=A0ACB8QZV1_9AGAM|nr:hypothetical protein FA95DRAFT_1614326 [Auriscalpium vulgare]